MIGFNDLMITSMANYKNYSNDSFDRFGDDLCQVLINYLPFRERFRFECICKQWKRLLFTTITDIEFDKQLDERLVRLKRSLIVAKVKTMIDKCKNMTGAVITHTSPVMNKAIEVMIINSNQLNTLVLNEWSQSPINETLVNQLLEKFGKQLTRLSINTTLKNNVCVLKNLKLCPNLITISLLSCDINNWFKQKKLLDNTVNGLVVNKLQSLVFMLNNQTDNRVLLQIIDNSRNSLKKITIRFDSWYFFEYFGSHGNTYDSLIASLSQISGLIDLDLTYEMIKIVIDQQVVTENQSRLIEPLKQIGLNCHQLKHIGISYDSIEDQRNLLKVINDYFTHIKRLTIHTYYAEEVIVLNIECLNKCLQLTHLTIFSNGKHNFIAITTDDINQMHKVLPNIHTLNLIYDSIYSDSVRDFRNNTTVSVIKVNGYEFWAKDITGGPDIDIDDTDDDQWETTDDEEYD